MRDRNQKTFQEANQVDLKQMKRAQAQAKAIQKRYERSGETPKGRDKVRMNRINGQAREAMWKDGEDEYNEYDE